MECEASAEHLQMAKTCLVWHRRHILALQVFCTIRCPPPSTRPRKAWLDQLSASQDPQASRGRFTTLGSAESQFPGCHRPLHKCHLKGGEKSKSVAEYVPRK